MVSFVITSISLFLLSISLFFCRLTNGYHLSLTPLDWTSANTYCQSRCQSTLASIHTTQEYFIAKEILSNNNINSNEYIWFGLHNKDTPKNTFQYVDGTGSTDLNLWATNQPDTTSSSTAHCAAIKNNEWFNKDCDDNKYIFFCNSCDGVVNKQFSPSLEDTFTTKTAAVQECGINSMADIDTLDDAFEAKATLGYNSGANAWINGDQCQQINGGVSGLNDMSELIETADVGCDAAPEAPVLCSMQSEICKPQNHWEVIYEVGGPGSHDVTFDDDECGMRIESQDDNTIVGLTNKEWKTCGDEKPFVVEMKYRTRSPGYGSRTGLVFYPHHADNPYDHYYVRIHPVEQMVNLGYIHGGIEETLIQAGYAGLDIELQDMIWETLRVEVYLGHVFVVYLNGIAIIPGAPILHFELNEASNSVMSGYIGIQSKYGDIDVKYLYASGMEVYYHNAPSADRQLLTQWMQQCSFATPSPTEVTPAPTTSTPSPTAVTSAPTPTTSTTATTTASSTTAPPTTTTATTTTAQSTTDSTASSSNIADDSQSGNYGGDNGSDTATDEEPQADNVGDINIDTESENDADAFVTGGEEDGDFVIPPLYIYVPLAAGVFCCMLIVGIYYCRLKTQRSKKRELEGIFGRQSISMSASTRSRGSSQKQRSIDREIASHIQEAVRQQSERNNQDDEMDPDDIELDICHPEGIDHMHAVPMGMSNDTNYNTARTSSTVWNDNRLYHPENNPQRQDIRDSVIMSTWDVEALEMDCNDIIKNNNKMPRRWRARAYSD